jgi:hypothetical protein
MNGMYEIFKVKYEYNLSIYYKGTVSVHYAILLYYVIFHFLTSMWLCSKNKYSPIPLARVGRQGRLAYIFAIGMTSPQICGITHQTSPKSNIFVIYQRSPSTPATPLHIEKTKKMPIPVQLGRTDHKDQQWAAADSTHGLCHPDRQRNILRNEARPWRGTGLGRYGLGTYTEAPLPGSLTSWRAPYAGGSTASVCDPRRPSLRPLQSGGRPKLAPSK